MLFVRVIITVIILDGCFFFLFLSEDDVYIRIDFWEGECGVLWWLSLLSYISSVTLSWRKYPGLEGLLFFLFFDLLLAYCTAFSTIAFASSLSLVYTYLPSSCI